MLWLLSKHLPSTASDHITGKQIPTQNSSFSCPEHSPRTHVCPALPAERSGQSLICQAGGLVEVLQIHALNNAVNIQGTWEFNTHVRQAVGSLGEGKIVQIKQLHPHTAFLKVTTSLAIQWPQCLHEVPEFEMFRHPQVIKWLTQLIPPINS